MIVRTLRQSAPALLLLVSALGCNSNKSDSSASPVPERAVQKEAKAQDTAMPAPSGAPAAAPSGAPAAEQAEAKPAVDDAKSAAGEKADDKAKKGVDGASPKKAADSATEKADDKAKGGEPAKEGGAAVTSAPNPKNGILGAAAADKIIKVGSKPIVKLLQTGSEPREKLAYMLDKGSKAPLQMSMDMTMSMKMAGQSIPPTAVPQMVMGLDMSVADKNGAGDAKIDALLSSVGLSPKGPTQEMMAEQIRPQIEGMKGLTMGYWVSPTGFVRDVKLDVPAGFPPQAQQMLSGMNQSFESMVAPLPDKEIGIGASWEVVTRIVSSGADLVQFAVYTLKERNGTKASLDIVVKQLAAKETINAPGMPAGASAKLTAFSSQGAGSNRIDMKMIAPDTGKMDVESAMDLSVSVGASPAQQTSVNTKLSVQFTRPLKK